MYRILENRQIGEFQTITELHNSLFHAKYVWFQKLNRMLGRLNTHTCKPCRLNIMNDKSRTQADNKGVNIFFSCICI